MGILVKYKIGKKYKIRGAQGVNMVPPMHVVSSQVDGAVDHIVEAVFCDKAPRKVPVECRPRKLLWGTIALLTLDLGQLLWRRMKNRWK